MKYKDYLKLPIGTILRSDYCYVSLYIKVSPKKVRTLYEGICYQDYTWEIDHFHLKQNIEFVEKYVKIAPKWIQEMFEVTK